MNKEQPTTITWDDDDPLAGFLMNEANIVEPQKETDESTSDDSTDETVQEEISQVDENPEVVEKQEEDRYDTSEEGEVDEEEYEPHQVAAKVLHNLGIIDLQDDDQVDDLVIQEKLEQTVQQRVMDQFNEMANSLDEDSYKLVDYLLKGGSWRDFQSLRQESASTQFKMGTEKERKDFLEYYYTQIEGKSAARARREIEFLDDEGLLEEESDELYTKLQQAESELVQQEIEQRKKQQAENLKTAQQREQLVIKHLKESGGYNDIALSTRDKKLVERDILKKTEYNKDTKKYETKLTQMLRETFSDPQKLIALDYVLRNDFKLDIVKKKGATEVISRTEKDLQRKTPPRSKKSGAPKTQVPLWEQMDRNK